MKSQSKIKRKNKSTRESKLSVGVAFLETGGPAPQCGLRRALGALPQACRRARRGVPAKAGGMRATGRGRLHDA